MNYNENLTLILAKALSTHTSLETLATQVGLSSGFELFKALYGVCNIEEYQIEKINEILKIERK